MSSLYNPANQNRVLELLSLLRPQAMRHNVKIRLGNEYDGGYVVPISALRCDAIISIGVGPDVSFDLALAQRGAQVVQFDHTVEKSPIEHPAFRFFKKGWGSRTEDEFLSLVDIDATLPAECQHKLLKFDVEGAEYDIFEALQSTDLTQYEVICCELHLFDRLNDQGFFAKAEHLLRTLHTGHAPVHLHANNYMGFIMAEGVPIPNVLEITYLRRDLDSFTGPSHEPIPGPLDRPNNPYKPDLCLNPF